MANKILVAVQDGLKEPEWIDKIESFERKILEELKFDGQEISITFCDNDMIQELNREYREIDNPTDILSFEIGESYTDENGEEWFNAGDMIISLDTLPENARYFEVDENEELKRLLIHGTLHLKGYDHGEEHIEKDVISTDPMLVLQENVLNKFKDVKIINS